MQHVLFIQGAGSDGAHAEDQALADSLQQHLGTRYAVRYPQLPDEAEPDFETWKAAIEAELTGIGAPAFLVGHSIGASVLAKILSSSGDISSRCRGLFLVAGPFWHEDDFWRWDDCALPPDAGQRMPADLPIYLYHGEADPFVPVAHVEMYAKALPQAVVRRLPGRDHQLNENFAEVAQDIDAIASRS